MEDAGSNVVIAESLFQEINELELEDSEDDPDYNPTDPESDLTHNGLFSSKERCDCHSICDYTERVLIFLSLFFLNNK